MDQFPIRVIAELTGVPATTLRAWERRYGLLKPARAPSGHRLYNNDDLETVRRVIRLLDAGQPIREAARNVRAGGDALPATAEHDHWRGWIRRLMRAVGDFDHARLDAIYNEALSLYPMDLVTERLICPVLVELGNRWQERDSGVAEEHYFTAYLRNKLGARLHHEAQRPRGCRLLAACLPGEHHEIGLLLFSLAALGRGYRILYFGSDLPLEQIPAVAARISLCGVVLSATRSKVNPEKLHKLVQDLDVPVFLGGDAAVQQQELIRTAGGHCIGSHATAALEQLESRIPAHGKP